MILKEAKLKKYRSGNTVKQYFNMMFHYSDSENRIFQCNVALF